MKGERRSLARLPTVEGPLFSACGANGKGGEQVRPQLIAEGMRDQIGAQRDPETEGQKANGKAERYVVVVVSTHTRRGRRTSRTLTTTLLRTLLHHPRIHPNIASAGGIRPLCFNLGRAMSMAMAGLGDFHENCPRRVLIHCRSSISPGRASRLAESRHQRETSYALGAHRTIFLSSFTIVWPSMT